MRRDPTVEDVAPLVSPRRLRASDLRTVALSARRLSEALATPCGCPRDGCTIGEHVYRATRDGRPGVRAQQLDETRARHPAGGRSPDVDKRPDRNAGAHDELRRLAATIHADTEALAILIATWRPDRHRDDTTSDSDWCRHHLDTIGVCEPRYRGDQCRRCYDFTRAKRFRPPDAILLAWHRGERVTDKMVRDAQPSRKRRRKRRSTGR